VAEATPKEGPEVAIDLGLKELASLSNGRKIEMPAFYRRHEARLALAQRCGQKRLATTLHAKVKNSRKHDVNSSRLAQTRMAKSVLDASWSMFRGQLCYKALRHGVAFKVVSEMWTTQTCSDCAKHRRP
jgi:transposase